VKYVFINYQSIPGFRCAPSGLHCWTWFTLFIGFNCFQSSFTGFCPPSWLMKKFGLKTEAELALGK